MTSTRCEQTTKLDSEDIDRLNALPCGAFEMPEVQDCHLESGHPGEHGSIGQSQDFDGGRRQVHWWVRWDDAGYRICELPLCGAEDAANDAICGLFEHHFGEHLWS